MALRFENIDTEMRRLVEDYARAGFRLSDLVPVTVRYTYRVVEQNDVDIDTLNQLGQEGWALAATLPTRRGVRLVFMRPV